MTKRFRRSKDSYSSVTPMLSHDHGRLYDKEFLYRLFHEHSDRNGVLLLTQQELAKEADIPYQQVCTVMKEFIEAGYMSKAGQNRSTRKFSVLYHPDDVDWEAYLDWLVPPRKE